MNSKVVAISLLASSSILGLGYSSITFADVEYCYDVSGYVSTQNVTQTTQVGSIDLVIKSQVDPYDVVFEGTGNLVGNITSFPETSPSDPILLSHVAKFPKGNSFVTNGDEAYLWPKGEDGCLFDANETIKEIAGGTRFFKDVTNVKIQAYGEVSYCPQANMNWFSLDGEVCFEDPKP